MPDRTTWTVAQLAERFQISPRTVLRRAQTGQWPCLDLGPRTKRFTETHIARIEAMTEHQPTTTRRTRRTR